LFYRIPEIFALGSRYIAWAEKLRKSVAVHVEANGIFSPAVSPLNWGDHTAYTTGSPEGQSFGDMYSMNGENQGLGQS
jgi:hypothetical protein